MIREQGGVCPISLQPFDMRNLKDAVVDHDHKSGLIRGVLSRSANGAEGKVRHAVGRWGGTGDNTEAIVAYLERLVAYLKAEPTPFIYPFHKSADDRREERNRKAREARAARAAKARMNQERAK